MLLIFHVHLLPVVLFSTTFSVPYFMVKMYLTIWNVRNMVLDMKYFLTKYYQKARCQLINGGLMVRVNLSKIKHIPYVLYRYGNYNEINIAKFSSHLQQIIFFAIWDSKVSNNIKYIMQTNTLHELNISKFWRWCNGTAIVKWFSCLNV